MKHLWLASGLVGIVITMALPGAAQSLPNAPIPSPMNVANNNPDNSRNYGEILPRSPMTLDGFPLLSDSLQIFVPPANSPMQILNAPLNPNPSAPANSGGGMPRRTLSEILLLEPAPIPGFAR